MVSRGALRRDEQQFQGYIPRLRKSFSFRIPVSCGIVTKNGGLYMATTAQHLDLSLLSPTARREVQDFYQFLLTRSKKQKQAVSQQPTPYRFSDLCGKLSWKGDALASQRDMRDEW